MTDPFTLDQLRTLLLVAEHGSFSAAARKLRRVQSAVSQSMANLERELEVVLWNRETKTPTLTEAGRAVLAATRSVCAEADDLRRLAESIVGGLEPSVHLCVDALFPLSALAELCSAFAREFPTVDLRVDTQIMTAVSARVLDGTATLGVVTPKGLVAGLESHRLAPVRMLSVVAPNHPLASARGEIPRRRFADVVQVVLTERSEHGTEDQAVLSHRTWRIADIHTKRALLRAGLGWGNLPEHLVRADLRRGTLVRIRPEGWRDDEHTLRLWAVHRADTPFGPAHRWLVANLAALCKLALAPAPAEKDATSSKRKRR
ncbi:MAG TPA: LysR family transcriptional regulator [Polyangiaceae bacterium]|nr:LysR family transcriptional regulator [Polyangiaceae bacterium]